MENLKKYWWLFLLVPVVLYMVYIMSKENGKAKPGSPEYARQAKADKAILKEVEKETTNGGDSTEGQSVNA